MSELDIKDAINRFEAHNSIVISQYCHPNELKSLTDPRDQDSFIAESVFYDRIVNWIKICNDTETEKEFLRLLSVFDYFPSRRYINGFSLLINTILNKESTDLTQVLFITEASESHCKSGGDEVRGAVGLVCRGILSNNAIRAYSHDKISYNKNVKTVIFLDDITGSGQTMYGMVKSCVKKNPWIKNTKIWIACLCGRKRKIVDKAKELRKMGLDVEGDVLFSLNKCYTNSLEDIQRKTLVEPYEKRINDQNNLLSNDTEPDCTMGYKGNQLLVSFYYNTPNNTLSLFWRKTKISPDPLFVRFPKPRPNISWLSKRKKQVLNFAYRAFRVFK